jgi:hypothetical protein
MFPPTKFGHNKQQCVTSKRNPPKKTTNFVPSTLHQYQNYPPSIFTQKSQPKPFLNKIKHKNYETIIYTSVSFADPLQTPFKHKGLAWRPHASRTILNHGNPTPLPFPRKKGTTNRNINLHSQSGWTTKGGIYN